MRWPKHWSFGFSISPSNEYSGLISFRMDWLDLLAVQETLKSLLQPHSSKASILWHSAFFTVQLSHPCVTKGKTTALTMQTFVGKLIFLLFNVLSRLVTAFLPRAVLCCAQMLSRVWLFATPWTVAGLAPLSTGILQAKILEWVALPSCRGPFQPRSLALQADSLPSKPPGRRLLISWLQSPSTVILEPKKIKSVTVSTLSPSICHEVMGLDAMILVF